MTPNNCTSANNTSAKLSALIADQTLLLRHHKRRQQKQQQHSWREIQNNQSELLDQDNQLQSLIDLQQQLTKTKEHLLETQICQQQQNNSSSHHHQIINGGKIQIQNQLLQGSSSNTEGASTSIILEGLHPLRRCSSLSHTDAIGLYSAADLQLPLPPQKINGISCQTGSSPAQVLSSSSNSPWLSSSPNTVSSSSNPCGTPCSSANSTSISNNGIGGSSSSSRYLYRGKFQPPTSKSSTNNSSTAGGVPTTSNNNNSYNKKKNSPWQLRSNLSSFARRRRGSSTSLHNFSDDEENNTNGGTVQDSNNCKQTAVDSISLADSADVLSMNHR